MNPVIEIVAIDDNAETLHILKKHFDVKYPEFKIHIFSDGNKCLHMIRKGKINPKAAIVDRYMPNLPGNVLSLMIKTEFPEICTILYTAECQLTVPSDVACYKFDYAVEKATDGQFERIANYIKGWVNK